MCSNLRLSSHFFKTSKLVIGKLALVFCLFCFNLNNAFAQPANDLCVDAEEITIDIFGSGFRTGNTSSATTTDAPADCGAAVENNDVGGLWYTFTGTGANQLYTFTTCHGSTYFDTEISVYTGTCGSLTCRDGNDDGFCHINGGTPGVLKSTVNILSEASEQYYIYVNGNSGASGNFRIYVYNNTDELLANDQCINAQELTFGTGASATSANGSLIYATSTDAPEDCGDNVNNGDSEGLWYTFTGTGAGMLYNINTCSGTNFDTEISVFSGSCGSLTCLDGNDDNSSCGNSTRSSVDLVTTTIEPYYIYVKGNNGSVGNFRLEIENQNDRLPGNDLCENAIVIPTPTTGEEEHVSGTLDLASTVGAPADCGDGVDNDDSGGIWYTFTALENKEYVVYTCPLTPSAGGFVDTELSVFKGSCGSLTCVSENNVTDCGIGLTTTFSFSDRLYVTEDTQFFIYLKGTNGATGDFDIRIFDSSPDPQVGYDICNDEPLEIDLFPWGASGSVSGSTRFVTDIDAPASCTPGVDNNSAGGLWIEFTGTGNRLYEISTCNPGTEIDTEVSVYSGSCGSLTCINGNDDDPTCSEGSGTGSTFTFVPSNPPSNTTERVFIYLKGAQNNYGNFTLTVDDISPLNDDCARAENMNVPTGGMVVTSGTLVNASDYDAPANCGAGIDNSDSGGVWYTFTGNNNRSFLISTCSANTHLDTEISVFTGSCGSFTCVDGSDDDGICSEGGGASSSSLTITAPEADTPYYVYVKGNGGATGTFDISIEDLTPVNDLCSNFIQIFPSGGSASVTGTINEFATTTGVPASCDAAVDNDDSGGVWYMVSVLPNESFEFTTCSAGSNFDTEISVYASTACGTYTCVGSNDDDSSCSSGSGSLLSTVTWTNNLNFNSSTFIYVKGNAGATGDFTLTVTQLRDLQLSAKAFLEGPYDSASGLMDDDLRDQGLIPGTEPYSANGETVNTSVLAVTGDDAIVDWVLVELRDKNLNTSILHTRAALLQRDGDIVDTDGVSPLRFSGALEDDYFITIRHRNHLGIMTLNARSLSETVTNIDFTSSSESVYGTGSRIDLGSGILGLYGADADGSEAVNATDRSTTWNDRNLTGYLDSDCNLDGVTNASDRSSTWNNRNIGGTLPE